MDFNFNMFHTVGFKHQAADQILQLNTEAMDYSGIEDDIPIIAATTRAWNRYSEIANNTPEQTKIETSEQSLLTRYDFIRAKGTNAFFGNIWPNG